jgi:hypothetical protein
MKVGTIYNPDEILFQYIQNNKRKVFRLTKEEETKVAFSHIGKIPNIFGRNIFKELEIYQFVIGDEYYSITIDGLQKILKALPNTEKFDSYTRSYTKIKIQPTKIEAIVDKESEIFGGRVRITDRAIEIAGDLYDYELTWDGMTRAIDGEYPNRNIRFGNIFEHDNEMERILHHIRSIYPRKKVAKDKYSRLANLVPPLTDTQTTKIDSVDAEIIQAIFKKIIILVNDEYYAKYHFTFLDELYEDQSMLQNW